MKKYNLTAGIIWLLIGIGSLLAAGGDAPAGKHADEVNGAIRAVSRSRALWVASAAVLVRGEI